MSASGEAHSLEVSRLEAADSGTVEVSVRGAAGSWRTQVALAVSCASDQVATPLLNDKHPTAPEKQSSETAELSAESPKAVDKETRPCKSVSIETPVEVNHKSSPSSVSDADTGDSGTSEPDLGTNHVSETDSDVIVSSPTVAVVTDTDAEVTDVKPAEVCVVKPPPSEQCTKPRRSIPEDIEITKSDSNHVEGDSVSAAVPSPSERYLIVEGPASLSVLLGQTARLECRLSESDMEPVTSVVWSKAVSIRPTYLPRVP